MRPRYRITRKQVLESRVMVEERYEETPVGTPQGGLLSPMLSNIMLTELDREPEARGLHFVQSADECVIAAGSSAAANRVMHTVKKWIEKKLKLKVNATKTKVTRSSEGVKVPSRVFIERCSEPERWKESYIMK